MAVNYTIPCEVVQDFANKTSVSNIASLLNSCASCSVNKYASKQALYQARLPDNCNLYHWETPYPPLPIVVAPLQSSNVSWSSYTSAKNPLYAISTHKINSGGPFEKLNMNLYY